MKRFVLDPSSVLTLLTVAGMVLAVAGTWLPNDAVAFLTLPGIALVYLAGGLPAARPAL